MTITMTRFRQGQLAANTWTPGGGATVGWTPSAAEQDAINFTSRLIVENALCGSTIWPTSHLTRILSWAAGR